MSREQKKQHIKTQKNKVDSETLTKISLALKTKHQSIKGMLITGACYLADNKLIGEFIVQ